MCGILINSVDPLILLSVHVALYLPDLYVPSFTPLIVGTVTQEFEACGPSGDKRHHSPGSGGVSSALPAHSRHPTLGCKVFSSPARDLAIRACGWGVPADFATRDTGPGLGGGTNLASGDKRLKEVMTVLSDIYAGSPSFRRLEADD